MNEHPAGAQTRRTSEPAGVGGDGTGSCGRCEEGMDAGRGSAAAGAHAFEAFGEGVGGEDADVAVLPHGGGGVDIAAEAGAEHDAENALEGGLAALFVEEAIGTGVQEADGGDGEAFAAAFEHAGDGAEAALEIGEGEVVLAAGTEKGEDQDAVEIELEDVGLAVVGGDDVNGVVEDAGVACDGAFVPLAGIDEGAELADEAPGVVGVVDAADDGAVAAVEKIAEEILSPEDAEALGRTDAGGIGLIAREQGDAFGGVLGGEEVFGVAVVQADGGEIGRAGGHGRTPTPGSIPRGEKEVREVEKRGSAGLTERELIACGGLAGLHAVDVAGDLFDDEGTVGGVEAELEGNAGVEVLLAVEMGVGDAGGDGEGRGDLGHQIDAEPQEARAVGAAGLGLGDEQADAAAADVDESALELGADLGEDQGVGGLGIGAGEPGDVGVLKVVNESAVGDLGRDNAGGIEERPGLDEGEVEFGGRNAEEVAAEAAFDAGGHGELDAMERRAGAGGDELAAGDGGLEHPAVLAQSEDRDNVDAGAQRDGLSHGHGGFDEDLVGGEAEDADAPDQIGGEGRVGGEGRGIAGDGEFKASAAFIDLVKAFTPALGTGTACRHNTSPRPRRMRQREDRIGRTAWGRGKHGGEVFGRRAGGLCG